MPRWLRVIRGMIGTGLTFAVGVGGVATIVGALVWLAGGTTGRTVFAIAARSAAPAFILGVAFAGVLAVSAGGRQFHRLTLRLVGGLGAAAGVLLYGVIALNGGRNWTAPDAIANFVLLTVMGAGSAVAILVIARRARSALGPGDDVHSLGAGEEEIIRGRSRSKVEVPRP